jgi:predicted acylesterase/phospholipase RssA
MASPGLMDIPYFIRPIANGILKKGAAKLRATADSTLYWRRAAKTEQYRKTVGKFYDVMVDETRADFKGNAVKLKEEAKKGCDPVDCSISIAVSGGGLRVIAFLAFLEVFREHNIPIRAYAGTSAGALATTLDRIGTDYKTAWEILDARLLKSLLFALNWTGLGSGIMTGKRMMDFLDLTLPPDIRTFGKVPGLYLTSVLVNCHRNPTVTIDQKGKEIVQGELSSYEKVVFSSEFDPSMGISKGVFSSMCLPVFQSLKFPKRWFKAITTDGIMNVRSTKNGRTIDGGYGNNYPGDVLLLPESKANAAAAKHIVINVTAENPGNVEIPRESLFSKLVYTGVDLHMEEELRAEKEKYRDANVIYWEIGGKAAGVGLFDFNKIDDMRQAGRESAEKLLRTIGIMQ